MSSKPATPNTTDVSGDKLEVEEKEKSTTDSLSSVAAKEMREVEVYYFPTSYSSQKVLLCLFEKKIKFKANIVSLFHRQHMEPWYVRLNPNGAHVPVLVHGNRIINHPDKIIEYIDTVEGKFSPELIPPPTELLGQQVAKFLESLDAIPMDVISYGIIFHPDLSDSGCQLPVAIQRSMRENFTNRLRNLVTLSTLHPDLRDCYLAKSQTAAEKYDTITDEEKVKGHIEQLHLFLQKVEKELMQRYNSDEEADKLEAMYLFGDDVTAADIGLYILVTRLQTLGLLLQLLPQYKYPLTLRHFTLMASRPSVGQLTKEVAKLRYTLLVEDLKASGTYIAVALGAGMALAAAFYFVKRMVKH